MLTLTLSNRLSPLCDALLAALANGGGDPFARHCVIVPSKAVARHLELALCERDGVCAQVDFAFPGQWLWQQMARVMRVADASPFEPDTFIWRLYDALSEEGWTRTLPPLQHYLQAADPQMRLALAGRLATLYNQYLTYRPYWLTDWGAGRPAAGLPASEDARWQAALWQRLAARLDTAREHPMLAFCRHVDALPTDERQAHLPARAHLFVPGTLPPLTLEVLRRLGRWIDLRLYMLNPCREYWFDIVDSNESRRLPNREHAERGNRLLATWGKQARAALGALYGGDDIPEVAELYVPASGHHLLAQWQNAVLDLHELDPASTTLAAADNSFEIHLAHSLLREVEVLHDRLLAAFADDPALTPADIIVATPDLDAAAPLVDAVFASAPPGARIPYTLTGLAPTRYRPLPAAFTRLLALFDSRYAISEVFALLSQPPVARRFGLSRDALDDLHQTLADAGAHWGLDAAQREARGLPAVSLHSLDDAIERSLLATALPENAGVFAAITPAGSLSGHRAAALGALWQYCRRLQHWQTQLAEAASAQDWAERFHQLADDFLCPCPEDLDDSRALQAAIATLLDQQQQAGLRHKLPFAVAREALVSGLEAGAPGGVPSGAVTFCAMNSLRGLPYRMVCLLGLSDGSYPRQQPLLEFDLLARHPEAGDRQRRDDERNTFLDLLLAARDRVLITATGRSQRDNAKLPPSPLVSELLDTLLDGLPGSREANHRQLVIEHPLQPFSAAGFDPAGDPRRQRFDAATCEALASARKHPADGTFFRAPLPPAPASLRTVSLDELCGFLANPCRHLLQHRLGIHPPYREDSLQDDEPFSFNRLDDHLLKDDWLARRLAGADDADCRAWWLASGRLPAGASGDVVLDRVADEVNTLFEKLRDPLAAPCLPAHGAQFVWPDADGDWALRGEFGHCRTNGLWHYRVGRAKPAFLLQGWCHHLLYAANPPASGAATSTMVCRDALFRFEPLTPETARQHLTVLMAAYAKGLRQPLPFAPETAAAFVKKGAQAARAVWEGGKGSIGENAHWAYRLALRGRGLAFDPAFAETAHALLGPLSDALDGEMP